jgi:proteasome lid subunit RPN8/RPN11
MFEIEITAASNEVMSAHAVGTFPNECCGFFFGASENDLKIVTEIRPVLNVKKGDQRRRFSIDPFD